MSRFSPFNDTQLANARKAIPAIGDRAQSVTAIHRSQSKPRLGYEHLKSLLEFLEATGEVERIEAGNHCYYRYRERVRSLAPRVETDYNGPARSKSSLSADVDWFLQALYPLRLKKPVLLWMDDPRLKRLKNRSTATKRLVILTPGEASGLPERSVLVSVVGSGSCIVDVDARPLVANLVLAGMPAKLAEVLMNQLRHVFKEF